MKSSIFLSALCAWLFISSACSTKEPAERVRSVYYWNTTFNIDSVKSGFMAEHNIEKMYVRYFDVVASEGVGGFPHPNATIRIDSLHYDLPQQVVPVVFVLPDALKCDREALAKSIFSRAKQMSKTHGLGPMRELQIDCDWTTSTRPLFYDFMQKLKDYTDNEGIILSSTIRLHQLATSPPPADKGVLMVYNTGDFTDISKEKPILDPKDVIPYLKHLKGYKLPLATAYPIYSWELLFRNGKFVDIVHHRDELPILPSDTIVHRQTSIEDIMECRHAIESIRPECANEIILFDLNNYNINRYDTESFDTLYN